MTIAGHAHQADTIAGYAISDATKAFLAAPPRLLIGGQMVEANYGRTLEVIDPGTGRVIAHAAVADATDADRAVAAARRAFHHDAPWRRRNALDRGRAISRFARILEDHMQEIVDLEVIDGGKLRRNVETGDFPLAIRHLDYFAGWTSKIEGNTIPVSVADTMVRTEREPVGVVAQIVPWNYPLLMAMWKVAPALAAGCTIILKPAENTPLTALRFGQLALEAGIPAGVLNILTGYGHEAGEALVDHPDVDKVAFTGSTAVGVRIAQRAVPMIKRVTLELADRGAPTSCSMTAPSTWLPKEPLAPSSTTPARPVQPDQGSTSRRRYSMMWSVISATSPIICTSGTVYPRTPSSVRSSVALSTIAYGGSSMAQLSKAQRSPLVAPKQPMLQTSRATTFGQQSSPMWTTPSQRSARRFLDLSSSHSPSTTSMNCAPGKRLALRSRCRHLDT